MSLSLDFKTVSEELSISTVLGSELQSDISIHL